MYRLFTNSTSKPFCQVSISSRQIGLFGNFPQYCLACGLNGFPKRLVFQIPLKMWKLDGTKSAKLFHCCSQSMEETWSKTCRSYTVNPDLVLIKLSSSHELLFCVLKKEKRKTLSLLNQISCLHDPD